MKNKPMPGQMGNMGGMMKQVQKMQAEMARVQEELVDKQVEATAGGGAVKVVFNGHKQLLSISIDKEVVDPDDIEMLQDLVIAVVNEGLKQADELAAREMGKVTGGMGAGIPGLF